MRSRAGIRDAALLLLLAACSPSPSGQEQAEVATAPEPVTITHYYVVPSIVPPGGRIMMCYGVENADSVRIEPPVRELVPGYNRCITFVPEQMGVYTLTATGPGGEATAEATLVRGEAQPVDSPDLINFFTSSDESVTAGQPVTLCYGVDDVTRVELSPSPDTGLAPESSCFHVWPEQTTTYKLTVTAADGAQAYREVTIAVR